MQLKRIANEKQLCIPKGAPYQEEKFNAERVSQELSLGRGLSIGDPESEHFCSYKDGGSGKALYPMNPHGNEPCQSLQRGCRHIHSESEQMHSITQTKTYQLSFYWGELIFTTILYSAVD